jgi:hypothetical protein
MDLQWRCLEGGLSFLLLWPVTDCSYDESDRKILSFCVRLFCIYNIKKLAVLIIYVTMLNFLLFTRLLILSLNTLSTTLFDLGMMLDTRILIRIVHLNSKVIVLYET